MKAALFIVLALSALAYAGPAFKNNNNQIDIAEKQQLHQQQQQQQYMGELKQTQAIDTLKQWCFFSQMSQPELTSSFKKLVSIVKAQPEDQTTEAAVMSERICQGAIVHKSAQTGETWGQQGADAQAHELIKDVYMDALVSCESRECMQQLLKLIESKKVDTIRASYYMTRLAVTDIESAKGEEQVKQLAETFVESRMSHETSEAVERQKLLATTASLAKALKQVDGEKRETQQTHQLRQLAQQVVKTIVDRFVKPVSSQDVQQYQKELEQTTVNAQLAKKIAKRNAALKAIANLPGYIVKQTQGVEQAIVEIATNKNEQSIARQSAIECLEQNDKQIKLLKQIAFDQDEPVEVRVAAYRAAMTCLWSPSEQMQTITEQEQEQIAAELISELIKHCQDERNQQQDEQFVLYVTSHLNNMRNSQQPELEAIKETIAKNKQHYMQIQVLGQKLKQQLADVSKASRNYKLEQEFNPIDSGLVLEGDVIYGDDVQTSKFNTKYTTVQLPKLVRVNMSMPVMGETVNVIEVTLRQDDMDESILSALKIAQDAKFSSQSVAKVVDSFKQSAEQRNKQNKNTDDNDNQTPEADLTIKVDGCTVVYVSLDDFKGQSESQRRFARSISGEGKTIVESVIAHLKRQPIAFNRGINFAINERLGQLLDIDAHIIAGLKFESRAQGSNADDFEIVVRAEPRLGLESIVGPSASKLTSWGPNKKLLNRLSTKTALGLRLKFKRDELVDVLVELPMSHMDLFTVESQLIEQTKTTVTGMPTSYAYLPSSVYGQQDIYAPEEEFVRARKQQQLLLQQQDDQQLDELETITGQTNSAKYVRKIKRSIFEKPSTVKSITKFLSGKQNYYAQTFETSDKTARATGLRTKLRVVAAPKDMTLIASVQLEKYEPQMQGYRVQVQKVEQKSGEQTQYLIAASTPGSRVERQLQLRVIQQLTNSRTLIKADIQANKMQSYAVVELVHEPRQSSVKVELAGQRGQSWRHSLELGVQRGSGSQSGRVATTYKPYVSIDSSILKRPIQMQGVVSYQQQLPKTVITYELKCPTWGDFVQGKLIVDTRDIQSGVSSVKRSSVLRNSNSWARSMQSPLDLVEFVTRNDITLSAEIVGQLQQEHQIKMHQMIDWSARQMALKLDTSIAHKNMRKNNDNQISFGLKLDEQQQIVTIDRKCSQKPRDNFRVVISSDCAKTNQHELAIQCNYDNTKVVAYKHQVAYKQSQRKQLELNYQLSVLANELGLDEKLSGRTNVNWQRQLKQVESELASQNTMAKINMQWVSVDEHKFELVAKTPAFEHKTLLRCDKRQMKLESRTDKHQQLVKKIVVDLDKVERDCQILVEVPAKNVQLVLDLSAEPGKLSSASIKTGRVASKVEFSYETMGRAFANKRMPAFLKPIAGSMPFGQLKLKSNIKDMLNKEAYWLDSNLSADFDNVKSYLRFDSPIYKTDFELEPREQTAKLGLFARSKRSVHNFDLDNLDFDQQTDSIISKPFAFNDNKLDIANKMWAIRSLVKLPQLKDKARQAMFEFADKRQSHKHQFQWAPQTQRLGLQSYYNDCQDSTTCKPMSFDADLSAGFFSGSSSDNKPSRLSMQSQLVDFDIDASPFDGQRSLVKFQGLQRYPRSTNMQQHRRQHEGEFNYQRDQGYKAWMKHSDSADQHQHSWQLEADRQPHKWAKVAYESNKHGKANWEHKFRHHKHITKRSVDQSELYDNSLQFEFEPIRANSPFAHKTMIRFQEPVEFQANQRYSPIEYLKRVNARVESQSPFASKLWANKIDFDYQPQADQRLARFALEMPEDMIHESSFEFEPTESVYKMQSKLWNKRNQQSTYDWLAQTKPIKQQQQPFFAKEHELFAKSPISEQSMLFNLFKQPIKFDYTDKFGRMAKLDFDQLDTPLTGAHKYAGLRQKRAALFFKDQASDFEHESNYDFYPEMLVSSMSGLRRQQQQQQQPIHRNFFGHQDGDFALKTNTKYGPIAVQVDSDERACQLKLVSPIANAKLVAETQNQRTGLKLIKLQLDNKQQTMSLAKLVRKLPIVDDCKLAEKLARKFDDSKLEHNTELIVSLVDSIFKIKSTTFNKQSPVMIVDGELNKPQEKLVVKIEGKRVDGQIVVDLATKSANWVLNVDDKRTLQHQVRVVRASDKFYSVESVATYKQQPIYKFNGKIAALIIESPLDCLSYNHSHSHSFQSMSPIRRQQQQKQHYMDADHLSTFDMTIFEPSQIDIQGQIDCGAQLVSMIIKDIQHRQTSQVRVQVDQHNEKLNFELNSPKHHIQQTINYAPLVSVY